MTIKVEDSIKFPHVFFISYKDDKERYEINNWLPENCQGQWLISGSTQSFLIYSPVKYKSPIKTQYRPPYVALKDQTLIMFECEEDATLFKLTFLSGK